MISRFIVVTLQWTKHEAERIFGGICATWTGIGALAAMLFIDCAFVISSGIAEFKGAPFGRWHIAYDGGFPEKFQYLKWTILIVLLVGMFHQRRTLIYLAWTALFGYLLIDDSVMLHERGGMKIAQFMGLQPAFGLNPGNFGELIVTAIAAVPLLGFLAFCFLKHADETDRQFSAGMMVLVGALAFFGVVVDELDVIAPFQIIRILLALAEDGGEMAVASVMVCYAFTQVQPQDRPYNAMRITPPATPHEIAAGASDR